VRLNTRTISAAEAELANDSDKPVVNAEIAPEQPPTTEIVEEMQAAAGKVKRRSSGKLLPVNFKGTKKVLVGADQVRDVETS
jgi:hypothetical protein